MGPILNVPLFRNTILMLVGFVALPTLGCCSSFDQASATEDKAARQWLNRWKEETLEWTDLPRWSNVVESKLNEADSLLRTSAFLRITETQAADFAPRSPQQQSVSGSPYLLRGVCPAGRKFPQEVRVGKNGDVWVGGGANSRCPVAMERSPIVAWLNQPPHDVYVTFVVAK